jgi:ABC-2 type transport system ATP-binding protein
VSAAILTAGLTKRYGTVTALHDVDLVIGHGEIYGLIGRNGAGKTTTIRLLLGMVRPSAGYAELQGMQVGVRPGPDWRRVGYLVEAATAYPELSVRENLQVAGWLHGVRDAALVADAIERLELARWADRPAGTLSSGGLQRLALARALMHRPQLLILDEPTSALDPAGVVEVRELLRSLAHEHGTTVFMSSHILTEIERNATRIGIVHAGRIVAELKPTELDRQRRSRLEVSARDAALAEELLRRAGFDPLRVGKRAEPVLEIDDTRAVERPDDVARVLVEGGAPPVRLAVVREDIERVFLRLTEPGT